MESRLAYLNKCWEKEIRWNVFPTKLEEGCKFLADKMNVPDSSVLFGLLGISSYICSNAIVKVSNTMWEEPAINWLAVCTPTGSGKSTVYRLMSKVLKMIKNKVEESRPDVKSVIWTLDDQSFEKMGALMAENNGKAFALQDELTNFLTQINIYSGSKGLLETNEFSRILQMYNGNSWTRKTVGEKANFTMETTGLSIFGMTQPSTAYSLITEKQNIDKGLTSRFLWLFPKPKFNTFEDLKCTDDDTGDVFIERLCEAFSKQVLHNGDNDVTLYRIDTDTDNEVSDIYDKFQQKLKSNCLANNLLSALYSKGKGQVLRLCPAIQLLFNIFYDGDDEQLDHERNTIRSEVIRASVEIVSLCIDHVATVVGMENDSPPVLIPDGITETNQRLMKIVILNQGREVFMSAMQKKSAFKVNGGKNKIKEIFQMLENRNAGTINIATDKISFLKTENIEDEMLTSLKVTRSEFVNS
ncbi:uncharacterized protein LOC141898966 [Tubulanus polymorphus]|uniref:uncharacterized protein LOC141898966 n=1 Tax=Tubulanus polymorphus TaxID=672921 RepID=UPI003DA353B8